MARVENNNTDGKKPKKGVGKAPSAITPSPKNTQLPQSKTDLPAEVQAALMGNYTTKAQASGSDKKAIHLSLKAWELLWQAAARQKRHPMDVLEECVFKMLDKT